MTGSRILAWAACVLAVSVGCASRSGPEGDSDSDGDVHAADSDVVTDDAASDAGDTATDDSLDAGDAEPPEFDCGSTEGFSNPAPGIAGHTEIARWKHDRSAALTINFDDSTPGQATLGVPAMIVRGLTGTWFVNPGTSSYLAHQDRWETDAPAESQELANHTMDHAGAADYADAEYQIGEASRIIVSAYPPSRSPLMGFNRGGGTTWNVTEEQVQSLLEEFHCIERAHSTGIYPATPGETMLTQIGDHLSSGGWADDWGNVHFHGICDPADAVNCVCDTPGTSSNCREYGGGVNNGAVSLAQFETFLDGLITDSYFVDDVWIAGFISAHKYQAERNGSQVVMIPDTDERIVLCLSSPLDPALYDESLTLMTELPGGWISCIANQDGVSTTCRIDGTTAFFEALPDGGAIVLSQD
ncbi:MAG: hypothetical protein JRG91_20830 [Deltaproteobacteria bacterium]|nr:hypothetical protein [Deltaproteobacteria bacterium]